MSTFSINQIAALKAPLNRSHVKERKQAGRALSYVESWHAIAEANRIFGFGAWDRETVEVKCVNERERKVGKEGRDGFAVSYIARVRITVRGIVREGCGAGHGIDADLGLAHESALKEAESDAMKRALMTFGNPFGLALYDKEQANVSNEDDGFDESTELYMEQAREKIASLDYADLPEWWKAEAQSRRDFGLTQEQVDELKGLVAAKAPQKAA